MNSISIFTLFFLVPIPFSFASELMLQSNDQHISVNQPFAVNVVINPEIDEINAVEGSLTFPRNLLDIQEIRDGESIVHFWIIRPAAKNANNQASIEFSGVITGGYTGQPAEVFSVVFSPKQAGTGSIMFDSGRVLLNDGKGTEAQLTTTNYQFEIVGEPVVSSKSVSSIEDYYPPEVFDPVLTQSSFLYGGQYVLVFAAQDKASGIDHYEVKEGDDSFVEGQSPYVLKNQNLNQSLIVRAVDKQGNTREAYLKAPLPNSIGVSKLRMYFWISALSAAVILGFLFHKARFA